MVSNMTKIKKPRRCFCHGLTPSQVEVAIALFNCYSVFSQFTFTTPICTARQTEEMLMLRMDPVKEKEKVFSWMWSLVLFLMYLCKC